MIEVRTIAYSEMGLFDEQLSNLLNEGWEVLHIQHSNDWSAATLKRFRIEVDEDF